MPTQDYRNPFIGSIPELRVPIRRHAVKRAFDLGVASIGLIVLSPVLLILMFAVGTTNGLPILFRQQRVGQRGRLFTILKFRTMVNAADKLGPSITAAGDSRITRIGRFMRKTKLDELPQLWNVLVGNMSVVGPRPEVPRYVAMYTPDQKRVLELKPGITDLASIEFRNEEELLGTADNTEKYYLEYCLPRKIELNLTYAARANVWTDTAIILRTLLPFLGSGLGPGTDDR